MPLPPPRRARRVDGKMTAALDDAACAQHGRRVWDTLLEAQMAGAPVVTVEWSSMPRNWLATVGWSNRPRRNGPMARPRLGPCRMKRRLPM